MNFLDLILIILIVACTIIGGIRGLIAEVFSKGTPVLSVVMAVLFYKKLFPYINQGITNETAAIIVSFIVIFIACFLVLKIVEKILKSAFDGDILGSLDHVLGLFFGFIEGVAFACVILIILVSQPWFDTSELLANSFVFNILYSVIQLPIQRFEQFQFQKIGENHV